MLETVNAWVWGLPTLALILGLGIYLTAITRGVQFRKFSAALKAFFAKFAGEAQGDGVSSYRALCTALAATVGTGNLAGVAGAIAIGGPGAVFWMWVCGFLGMAIKFAEASLAVRYRVKLAGGEYAAGPMYMIRQGMKRFHFLAGVYAFFGVVAAFGVGNATQINTLIQGVHSTAGAFHGDLPGWFDLVMGIALGAVTVYLFLGGAERIGQMAEVLVPFAACAYMLLCLWALAVRLEYIPKALGSIITGAFTPRAATGGAVGSAFITLRIGISRGIFTNEAGMGTASIAHGSANVKNPWEQGYMGIMEVFLDTIVMCTMTALVILSADISIAYGEDTGILLTLAALESVFGKWVRLPITLFLSLFAFATVLGWGLYGGRCAQYLFGDGAWKKFVIFQGFAVAISAVLECRTVWTVSEILNGCMAIPNLLALAFLSREVRAMTEKIPGRREGLPGGKLRDFQEAK